MKRFTLKTLGCKVNQYDTQALREQLTRAGWTENPRESGAQLCVVNTCTVTEWSDQKTRYYIRQARRKNPQAKIVLTGCFTAQMKAIPEVDAFVPNLEKENFLRVAGLLPENEAWNFLGSSFSISQFEGRTRAYVKIQDGCDAFCSFCVIPFVRGRSRSRPLDLILKEVQTLIQNGYQEIVLTGVHLASYGVRNGDPHPLAEVLEAVDRLPHYRRLRVSSLEPLSLTDSLIQGLARLDKLCPHFHLPVQSGSSEVLARMRRQYTSQTFLKNVEALRRLFPRGSISTDIIVGFPEETDAEFEETLRLCQEVGFSKVHLFPYSRRSGTLASGFPNVPSQIVKDRIQRLTQVCEEVAWQHKQKFLGETQVVLVEECFSGGGVGYTPNYLRVEFPTDQNLQNQWVHVQLESCNAIRFLGSLKDEVPQPKM